MATKEKTREAKKAASPIRWRLWIGLIGAGVVCVSTAVAAHRVHHFVTTDAQFALSRERRDSLVFEGLQYASRAKVLRVFAGDFERSVFAVPLDERRRRLLAIDWVEEASVSRIWPDRLMVRIRERRPVAFVSTRSGVLLIDRYGALLELPPQSGFSFPALRGIGEDEPEAQRALRVRSMSRLLEEMGPLAKDVSEVNAADPDNLRVIVQPDGKAVELLMGDINFAHRYRNFIGHYAEIQKRSPDVKMFDLRLDDRILAKE
jgi:cell division protein FtsQ